MVIKHQSKFVTEVLKTVNIVDLFLPHSHDNSRTAVDELTMWRTTHHPLMAFKGQTYSRKSGEMYFVVSRTDGK